MRDAIMPAEKDGLFSACPEEVDTGFPPEGLPSRK
jgi:hypothetical protein